VIKAGEVFGRWTVIGPGGRSPQRIPRWKCQCRCGAVRTIRGDNLSSGNSRSCRCWQADKLAAKNRGMSAPGA
jgi:hypothetical protein